MPFRVAAVALLLASPAGGVERVVTPEAFLDLVAGQTVSFALATDGSLVGVERFVDRKRSVWTRADGTCALGTISVHGAKICFVYDDTPGRPSCWWPFEEEGELYVRSTRTAEVQWAKTFEKRLLECVGEPLS
ncbi:hypothetical protein MWU52_09445 [Jannaschia sp. S6380]|uniref:hypothetical protein n=1 Tax=Jannaschia sp. S6380 TaxID=2926408 RepID=UPI001FF37883|nr:hypothetical protein [Jannaschia sp. S6380]MCK0167769.1 hypothetical protein [Jannaschia sp. S6380]